jgi:hypothetical protein
MVAGYVRSVVDKAFVQKCPFAFGAIARRYGGAIRDRYRTDWGSAFPHHRDLALDHG